MDTKKAVAAMAVVAEGSDLSLTLKDGDGNPFKVILDGRMVSSVIGTMLPVGRNLKIGDDEGMVAQVITLTGCRAAISEGRPILVVQLEGTVSLLMTFPRRDSDLTKHIGHTAAVGHRRPARPTGPSQTSVIGFTTPDSGRCGRSGAIRAWTALPAQSFAKYHSGYPMRQTSYVGHVLPIKIRVSKTLR